MEQTRLALVGGYAVDKLRDGNTYVVALVVGSMINLYGHLFVPWVRGQDSVMGSFTDHFNAAPGAVTISMVLAYCFPVCVGVYSAVLTRYRSRNLEGRAEFPDAKPDPVFRAAPNGDIVDAGKRTRELLSGAKLQSAQTVLGEQLWQDVLSFSRHGRTLPLDTTTHVPALDSWYVVTHSAARDGGVNIYLTRTQAPQ